MSEEPGIAVRLEALHKAYVPPLTIGQLLTLRWRRESVRALGGVDLAIPAGRIHAFVGPNGAGKTTLLKLVGGLLLPSAGRVLVHGLDPAREPVAVRALCGTCLTEARSFFLRLSGRENLRFFATLQGLSGPERGARVDEVLADLELSDVADRPVLSYSDGMRQRLALARALVHRPRVVLLDEVGRGLDPRLREKVYDRIRHGLAATGVTVLMASHLLDEVEALADCVTVIERGRFLATGSFAAVRGEIDRVFAEGPGSGGPR